VRTLTLAYSHLADPRFTSLVDADVVEPESCHGRAHPGRVRAVRVSHSESVSYDAFIWARRALNSQRRRFPARAEWRYDTTTPGKQEALAEMDPWLSELKAAMDSNSLVDSDEGE
jgi:hypothetical protein